MKMTLCPGPLPAMRDIGQVFHELIESGDAQLCERRAGKGLNLDGNILHVLRAPLRGDGDLLNRVGTGIGRVGCRRGRMNEPGRRAAEYDGYRIGQF